MRSAALSDICELVTDGTHYTPPTTADGIPFLTVKDMHDGGLDFESAARITFAEFARARAGNSAPRPGDVLFSKDGTVGKVHVVTDGPEFAVLSSIAILRPDVSHVDARYLGHALRAPIVLRRAMRVQTGTAIRRVILSDLQRVSVPLPTLAEQRRIVRILDMVDALRRARARSVSTLAALVSSSFQAYFGGLLDDRGLTVPLAEILARPLLAGAYYPKESYVSSGDGGVEMVHMSDAFYGRVERGKLKCVDCPVEDRRKYHVGWGDLLVARRSLNYSGAARPCFVPSDGEDLIFESSLLRITPASERVNVTYLYWYLNDERVRRTHILKIVTGATISGVNQKNLLAVPVVVPPMDLQRRFERVATSAETARHLQTAHHGRLGSLLAGLQHRAFTGAL